MGHPIDDHDFFCLGAILGNQSPRMPARRQNSTKLTKYGRIGSGRDA